MRFSFYFVLECFNELTTRSKETSQINFTYRLLYFAAKNNKPMSSKKITVVGFQYESKRVGCAANTVNDNLYDDDVEEQQLSNTVKCGRLDLL